MVVVVVVVVVVTAEAAATIKIWWHIGCRVGLFSMFGICIWTQNQWLVIPFLMLYSVVRMQFEYPAVPHYRVVSNYSYIYFTFLLLLQERERGHFERFVTGLKVRVLILHSLPLYWITSYPNFLFPVTRLTFLQDHTNLPHYTAPHPKTLYPC
jgi:hypothetical protein